MIKVDIEKRFELPLRNVVMLSVKTVEEVTEKYHDYGIGLECNNGVATTRVYDYED